MAWDGANRPPEANAATPTPTANSEPPYSPRHTAHPATAAGCRCCAGKNSTSTTTTTTTTTAASLGDLVTRIATSEPQPRRHEQSNSQPNREPSSPYTAGNTRGFLEAQTTSPAGDLASTHHHSGSRARAAEGIAHRLPIEKADPILHRPSSPRRTIAPARRSTRCFLRTLCGLRGWSMAVDPSQPVLPG
jgi:hypothetical protein